MADGVWRGAHSQAGDRTLGGGQVERKDARPRGPRSLFLRRCENGFGFTLRHFIVYPPESYTVLQGDQHLGLPHGAALDEPMDTIFVKSVRENGPAHAAGLATGDRIISVNGETITRHSYAQVVQLIQHSGSFLHLLVVPQEDDLLQRYFADTAHNPETNQRPQRVRSPELTVQVRPQSRWSSEQNGPSKREGMYGYLGSGGRDLRGLYPGETSPLYGSLERASGSKDSLSSCDSASTLTTDDSQYLSRLRKSFEQKEEFLRRPSQPACYGIAREFYARPQKLRPVWPPQQPATPPPRQHSPKPTHQSLRRVKSDIDSERDSASSPTSESDSARLSYERASSEPWETNPKTVRGQFLCGGAVTNVPLTGYQDSHELGSSMFHPLSNVSSARHVTGKSPFVSTLSRIHENLSQMGGEGSYASSNGSDLTEENGSSSLPSPGDEPSGARLVSRRARQFETGCVEEERTPLYRSELARLSAKRSVPNVALRKREFESRSSVNRDARRPNRESRSLESADPPSPAPEEGPVKLRARSNSAESWAAAVGSRGSHAVRNTLEWPPQRAEDEPQRHRAVRQDSYLAAVRVPVGSERKARLLKRQAAVPMEEQDEPPPSPAVRPTQLTIPNPLRPAMPTTSSPTTEGAIAHVHEGIGRLVAALNGVSPVPITITSDTSNAAGSNIPGVIRRQKHLSSTNTSDEDRLVRRVSYLKATWGDRMHVDSDLELSDSEHTQHRSMLAPHGSPRLDNKENHLLLREGWLHCKFTVIEGKRAADRSWKQVWAVIRGPFLYLYKDKRDAQQPLQTPLTGEESPVELRHSRVDIAGDYTKKKHVLRLNTLSCSELLLQAGDGADLTAWLRALQGAGEVEDCTAGSSNKQTSTNNCAGTRLSPLPSHKGIRKFTSFRNRSPTGQSPVTKTRKPSQSEQLQSPKTKTWKGRVAKQFRRIQQGSGSPSSPTAPHPEGVTIGIPLEECPQSSFSEFVPLLVELCTSIVEARGLDIIGIYRVPGNTAAVASLTEGLNRGFDCVNLQDQRWNDVNVISSLLKLFFRRLPDALLTSELYPHFIEADKIDDPGRRISTLRKLVHDLPDHHFETLRFLLMHLKRVVDHCDSNKMEARNLAIVFGPTLVRTADDNMVAMVTDMSHQCRIVESLISHVDWFFSEDDSDENIPFTLPPEPSDLEPASTNHSLLLSNIQKVEGMKAESSNKDISAKDIVSSIISAANRKMQKAKSRRTVAGSVGPEDGREAFSESIEVKQLLDSKSKRKNSGEEGGQNSPVALSVSESVLFTGNLAKSIAEDSGGALMAESKPTEGPVDTEEASAGCGPSETEHGLPGGSDEVAIWTYAGLSATTQERIRRFERETKAMLQRDMTRQRRDSEWREAEKRRIEAELLQARRDLEEDPLDALADDPSDAVKKLVGSPNSRSPSLARTTGTLSAADRPATPPPSSPSSSSSSSSFRKFTQTKKVGTTHFYPESPKVPAVETSGQTHTSTASISFTSSKQPVGKAGTEVTRTRTVSVPRETPAVEAGPLRRGNSAENLQSPSGEEMVHKTVPSGTLKRLKTGKEQGDLPSQPQPLSALRCGSLDSLQEAYSSEGRDRPQSDVSDDGSDLLASLTSTLDRKLKSLRSPAPSEPIPTPSSVPSKPSKPEAATATASSTPSTPSLRTKPVLFRDPSLHRGKSLSLEPQGKLPVLASNCEKKPDGGAGRCSDKETSRTRLRETASTGVPSSNRRSSPDIKLRCTKEKAETEQAEKQVQQSEPVSKAEKDAGGLQFKGSESSSKVDKEVGANHLKHLESFNKTDKESSGNRLQRSESLNKADKELAGTRLKRSESLNKTDRELSGNRLRRSESLTKAERSESPGSAKLKRSDSLTKNEKTESNISRRRQQERVSNRSSSREKENVATVLTKLKRKNGMPERSIKRRHTVGGTKDFDKLHWLDNRLQQLQLEENQAAESKERRCLRTSSPDLRRPRLDIVLLAELRHLSRPHSLPDPQSFKVPLESHV